VAALFAFPKDCCIVLTRDGRILLHFSAFSPEIAQASSHICAYEENSSKKICERE
jgi:hypothetical protein